MSEIINLTNKVESSLKTALLATERAIELEDLPGLSQFDIHTLSEQVYSSITTVVTTLSEEEPDFESSDNALDPVATESSIEENALEAKEDKPFKKARVGIPTWTTIVSETRSDNGKSVLSQLDHDSIEVAATETVAEEQPVEETVAEEQPVEETVAEEQPVNGTMARSEDQIWADSEEFTFSGIYVASVDEIDSFELEEEPTEAHPASKPQRISKDQVVLVVEQLIVNPNQANTTIHQGGQATVVPNSYPATPQEPQKIIYAQPDQSQPIFYSPPAVQASPVLMPQDMPTTAPQPNVNGITQPYGGATASPVYQPPVAPPAQVSVNMPAPTVNAPAMPSTDSQPTETLGKEIPHYEQTVFNQKAADQIIEIRSDATSISANTVSVESFQPLMPSLANFDPRKYFSPNEIIAPKLEDSDAIMSIPNSETNSMTYLAPAMPTRPSVPLPPIEDYRARPVMLGTSTDVIVEKGPEDVQKVTQMFKELRRIRAK